MNKFELYACDVETTGLSISKNEIIEVSLIRISTGDVKTWYVKPENIDYIESDALRINGHKLEDLLHKTSFGKDTYIDSSKTIIDIENWLAEDLHTSEERILVGHNIGSFDKDMLINLWSRAKSFDTFPFSKRFILDTMQIQLLLDIANNTNSNYYNLASLVERHGVKKEKAHRSLNDTRMCKDVFLKQIECIKK